MLISELTFSLQLDETANNEKTDTDKNMATMFDILRRNRKVKLENLILNRNSFAQTVENLFALSFLIKDGRAEISVDEAGCHLVCKHFFFHSYRVDPSYFLKSFPSISTLFYSKLNHYFFQPQEMLLVPMQFYLGRPLTAILYSDTTLATGRYLSNA